MNVGLGNIDCDCCDDPNCPCCCLKPGNYLNWVYQVSFQPPPGYARTNDANQCVCLIDHSPYTLRWFSGGPPKNCGGNIRDDAPIYWTRPAEINYACNRGPTSFAMIVTLQVNYRPHPITGEDRCGMILTASAFGASWTWWLGCGKSSWDLLVNIAGRTCPTFGHPPAPPIPMMTGFECATRNE